MGITEEGLNLENVITDETITTIDKYILLFKGKGITATRTRVFNNDLETKDSFEFESELKLSDEDKDVIDLFCCE